MTHAAKASVALFVIALIWGLTFPFIGIAIHSMSPSAFVIMRLLLSIIIFLPLLWRDKSQITWPLVKMLFFLGLFQGLCYLFQTISLETVPTANTAFITASSVVMVPFLAPLFKLKGPSRMDIIAALISALGIAVLTGTRLSHFGHGDVWAFASAIAYAFVINILQLVTKKYTNRKIIVSMQLIFTLPVPLLFGLRNWHVATFSWTAIGAIIYCALMATCLVVYLQTRYQHYVSVTRAALIYAFEPLFATLFAVWIEHQAITLPVMLGGGMMLLGFVVSSLQAKS